MNAKLSQRLGRVIGMAPPSVQKLSLDDRLKLQKTVVKAETFESLPQWIQDLMFKAEEEIRQIHKEKI